MVESGIYLVHKAIGETSFSVVRRFTALAREAGQRKWALGHGGTLDPFAEGLLLILSGQATRLMELLHPLPKTYEAELLWGLETDTCDHLGQGIARSDARSLTPEALETSLRGFLGWQDQIPPATCAKKIAGESAYKKAHRGEVVELPPSRVYLHEAHWLSHDLPRASRLRITCRGGYYVRSLARDLGRVLGIGAHLGALHRTAIGPWKDPGPDLSPASTSDLELVQGHALIPWCASRCLDACEKEHLDHGRSIPCGDLKTPDWALPQDFPDPEAPVRAMHEDKLVALLRERDGLFHTIANLRGGL